MREADIKVIDTRPTPKFLDQDEEDEEEEKEPGLVNISADRLRDKEEFYRAQLKKHSIQ